MFRPFEQEREWHEGLAVLNVDLSKAFDSVKRSKLLMKLRSKLGNTEEYRVWEGLLNGTQASLQTPWGTNNVKVGRGIRQGAVESPRLFGALIEWVP